MGFSDIREGEPPPSHWRYVRYAAIVLLLLAGVRVAVLVSRPPAPRTDPLDMGSLFPERRAEVEVTADTATEEACRRWLESHYGDPAVVTWKHVRADGSASMYITVGDRRRTVVAMRTGNRVEFAYTQSK